MKNDKTDFTQGSIPKKLALFMLPILGSLVLQAAYGAVDLLVVGRFGSTSGLSAVSTGSQVLNLVTFVVTQLAMGVTVLIARYLGEKKHEFISPVIGGAAVVFALLAAVLFGVLVFLARPISSLMQAPAEALDLTTSYVRICGAGIFFIVAYNMLSALFRGLGDSRSPLIFVLVACVVNIVGDLVLVAGFHLDAVGAAIATVLSQLLSGGLCAYWFFTRTAKLEGLSFRQPRTLLSAGHCRRLAYIGLPMGFEYSVSAIGAVIMQDAINLLGSTAVAAQTAGEKIRQMFTLPMESVGMAMATYVGQNHGARRTDRIRQGIKDGCMVQLLYCAVAWGVIFFIKPYAVGLVLGDADPAVTAGAIQYLSVMSMLFCFHGLLMIFRNTLQGLGYSVLAIVSGVGELIGRSLGGVLAVKTSLGYLGICLSNPFAWGLAMFYCLFMVCRILRRETQVEA